MTFLRSTAYAVILLLLLSPVVNAEDSDGDGFADPTSEYSVWDGADAFPNNPDIHEPVFSSGCDPPVATLDLDEPITFTCTVGNEGPVGLRVMIDVQDDIHLSNEFDAEYFDIPPSQSLELSVTMIGLSEGIATAHLRVFARSNASASHMVDLPIEVTGEQWTSVNTEGNSNSPPDVSFIGKSLDLMANWLTEKTGFTIERTHAGGLILLATIAIVGVVRITRARRIWAQNMLLKSKSDQLSEARFDELRKVKQHEHHVDDTIPDSPNFVIRKR